jgi:hypothetical protein
MSEITTVIDPVDIREPLQIRVWRRISGIALVAAVPAVIVGVFLHPARHTIETIPSTQMFAAHAFSLLAGILVLVGLPGLYAAYAQRWGIVPLIALLIILAGWPQSWIVEDMHHMYTEPVLAAIPATQHLVVEGGQMDGLRRGLQGALLDPLTMAGFLAWGIVIVRSRFLPSYARYAGWFIAFGLLVMLGRPLTGLPIFNQLSAILPLLGLGLVGLTLLADMPPRPVRAT